MTRPLFVYSYSLKRPYPYKWFTPVVTFGGIAALAVFSVINIASSGYTRTVVYTSDPDSTLARKWFGRLPAVFRDSTNPTCQPVNIQVNSQFVTNNSALVYTLRNVVEDHATDQESQSPALIYNQDVFQNCSVDAITLNLAGNDRTPSQIAISSWGLTANAAIGCMLTDTLDGSSTLVNLTTTYDLVPNTVDVYTGFRKFIGRNETTLPSLFWGESLLAAFWVNITSAMKYGEINPTDGSGRRFTNGFLSLSHNESTPGSDISHPYRLQLLFRFITIMDRGDYRVMSDSDPQPPVDIRRRPDIWVAADSFAKVFEATILADLGQQPTAPRASMLTDPGMLQAFSAHVPDMLTSTLCCTNDMTQLGLAASDYNTWVAQRAVGASGLGITPSLIATSYLCQVPQRKPLGELILSLLIADLVFLRASWALFKLAVESFMMWRDPDVYSCKRCLERSKREARARCTCKSCVEEAEWEDARQELRSARGGDKI
ncbi:hypothetical protein GQ53DRAFT_459974 [Thozetella sp. PMI_491]|nr:hypothetical protein GQ53DRAFT_459974 [Thozetella sp. PMI_491]